ncbi:acyltransferase family protein [Algirhabdus cladophorae]|uniref:acyltransferase family protein n=1 Tax=Algirhabdus cladophorae TaxID=3377108 RepID=UPI003B846ECB
MSGTSDARVPQQRALGLEILRFVLALAVLMYHYGYYGPRFDYLDGTPVWFEPLVFGRFAVPVFFIISGFVIAMTAQNRTLGAFALARFARLFPALALCSTLTFLGFLNFSDAPMGLIAIYWAKSISFIGVAWGGNLIDPSYWSLVYEWRFYIAIGLLIAMGQLKSALPFMTLVALAGALLEIAGFELFKLDILLFPFLPFFAIGMVFYQARETGWTTWLGLVFGLHCLLAIFGVFTEIAASKDVLFLSTGLILTAVAIPCLAILIFQGAIRLKVPNRLGHLATVLGAASYPLYLLHQNLGYFAINIGTERGLDQASATLLATLAMILLAVAIALWFEPRATAAIKSSFRRSKPSG